MKIWKTTSPKLLSDRKRVNKIREIIKENGYNEELKDIYLREILDQNKIYEWDQIFEQTLD